MVQFRAHAHRRSLAPVDSLGPCLTSLAKSSLHISNDKGVTDFLIRRQGAPTHQYFWRAWQKRPLDTKDEINLWALFNAGLACGENTPSVSLSLGQNYSSR